jgi:hypothetical protein
MVPYLAFPYAEHLLRVLNLTPNANATVDDIPNLIKAAHMAKQMVHDLDA